jgi:threonine dehydratase
MPERPNPVKARAIRRLGAELVEHGSTLEEARPAAERLAAERGMRLVGVADEPDLVAGVGTLYLELLEQRPDLDVIIVPVGSGSGAAAACLVAAALSPSCRVIAVQSAGSPAAHDSWRAGECVRRPNATAADGLATGSGFELPQRVLGAHLADFVLVRDEEIRAAQWLLLSEARTVAEGAGAAPLAALLALRGELAGRRVALVCTGGNSSETELRACVPGLADSPKARYAAAENTGR